MKLRFLLPQIACGLALAAGNGAPERDRAYHPEIDPANFSENVNHPYFTLKPGTTYVYKSSDVEDGEINKVTVTSETKKVMGVTTRVVLDEVWEKGKKFEQTYDSYAQDKDGNVWYFGEDSKEFKIGGAVSTKGSWEAGVNGAQPGIIMPANSQPGQPYWQEYKKGEAEDMGQIIGVKETVKTPAGTFENCVKTKDWSALEKGADEHKYYAKEVGNVVLETENGDKKRVELVEVKRGGEKETKSGQ
jgi:hypothetical protein